MFNLYDWSPSIPSQTGSDVVVSGELAYVEQETDRVTVAAALYTIDTEDSFEVTGSTYEIGQTTLDDEDGTDDRE